MTAEKSLGWKIVARWDNMSLDSINQNIKGGKISKKIQEKVWELK